jgi:hypothetical protein
MTHGEPGATAFHGMPRAAERLRLRVAVRTARERNAFNAGRLEFLSTTPARFLKKGTFQRALGVFLKLVAPSL